MDEDRIKQVKSRKIVSLINESEEIVISGIGSRFPSSESLDEFAHNLYNNIDMITEDVNGERWPKDLYGMNSRMGRLKNIDKFDGSFFGLLAHVADTIDPQSRILLETTSEAIIDAGYSLQILRGTKTGVYIGYMGMAMPDGYPQELQTDSKKSMVEKTLWIAGTGKNMYANRISFVFDFVGPSMVVDTACSSSLVAFDLAVTDIRLGKCDYAIVGATQLNLQPFTNFIFQKNNINAPDGISKVWDKDADGYVRGEAISCVLLERKSQAKRIYATVIHTKTNIDGHKKNGNFFPSKVGQQTLLEETCIEAGIDPNQINYFEAHGTGTKVGDPEEAKAIAGAYCNNRKDELLIGLLKSNIGHGEGTSGIASICKTIISFENKCIAANLNLKTFKPEIAESCPQLKPVNVNTPFEPYIAGVNSFGLGGVNAHAILKANKKESTKESFKIVEKIPRLVNICGRTQEGLDHLFNFIEKNPEKITRDFLALLNDTVKVTPQLNSSGFPYRGLIIINENCQQNHIQYKYKKESSILVKTNRPIWFLFSGMGNQWIGMGKSLMIIDKFAQIIHKCAQVIKQFELDLHKILLSDHPNSLDSIVNQYVAITSVQIALFELLIDLDVHPDGIIGHSFGEIACAYADGCLTLEQTMLCSYWRSKIIEDGNIPNGMMAAVGLSWEEAIKKCPKNVFVACDNAPDSVSITGLPQHLKPFLENLKSENLFVRQVGNGFNQKPYHTSYLNPIADILTTTLKKVIPHPKERSNKWYSTSVPEAKWNDELAKYASAQYFVNNLVEPVLFTSTIRYATEDAIIIEIAPHSLFQSLIKRTLSNAHYIGLLKKNDNEHNLETFLSSLGKLYQLGINVGIEKLYPKVEWPVARGTQSLGSLIKWDHNDTYFVKKYPEFYFPATASDMTFRFSLDDPDDQYLKDHCVEDRVIFPASGYLMLAWIRLAAQKGQQWNTFPVVFENVQFKRAVLFEKGKAKLTVRYLEQTGDFIIMEDGNIVASGKISVSSEEKQLQLQHLIDESKQNQEIDSKEEYVIDSSEFYRELRIRGYDYGPKFQNIVQSKFISLYNVRGKAKYTNNSNFVELFDSVFQMVISAIPIRSLFIPGAIQSMKCDPKMVFSAINKNKVEIQDDVTNQVQQNFPHQLSDQIDDLKQYKKDAESTIKVSQQTTDGGKQKWISYLSVFVDVNLKVIISNGIEVKGLLPINIPRKQLSNRLRLEKYEFVPYFEDNAIENSFKQQILTYINACSYVVQEIIKNSEKENASDKLILINDDCEKFDEKLFVEMTRNVRDDQTLLKLLNDLWKEQKESKNEMNWVNNIKKQVKTIEDEIEKDFINLIGKNERLIRPMIDTVNENCSPIKELKVIEINVTNGLIGVDIGEMQAETFIVQIATSYTFVHKEIESIKNIEEIKNGDYNLVEWNYLESAFPNINSDVNLVIHRDSIELWRVDLTEYIRSALNTIKIKGFMLAIFRTKLTQTEKFLFNLMENGKKYPDENELINRIIQFENVAIENGFKIVSKKTDSILFTAVLFRKITKNQKIKEQSIVEIRTGQYIEWLEMLKEKISEHKTKSNDENVWLIANDSNINGIIGLMQCLRMESGGDRLRCIFDIDNKLDKQIDFNKSPFIELIKNDLVMNIFENGQFGSMKHLNLTKDSNQVEVEEAYATIMQKGDLSSLQWLNGHNLQSPMTIPNHLKHLMEEVECDVYYSSLNFRDVMTATGRIAAGPESSLIDCLIGFEFAGRRRDNGQRVFGMPSGFGIATSVKTKSPLLFKVPDQWSLEDAATITMIYMTVWYGLIQRGQLRRGESILIHCGSGGVGHAAINVCQYYGCKIYTTVGTEEKRDFLKKTYGLTDCQIFSSRDTQFEDKILAATNGKGVNLVLNSLAEEKLQASFRCLSLDGRFIEIGKYDFQINNSLPMFAFLKNISFHGIVLDRITILDEEIHIELCERFKDWMYEGIEKGYVKPIQRTIWSRDDVKGALKYMMTGKHIGKVLIEIREDDSDQNTVVIPRVKMIANTKTWFHPNKVYILIGGLGGMGIQTIYWMMLRGAKKIIVTSRSGIKTNSQKIFFKQLKEFGKMVEAYQIQIEVFKENAIYENEAEQLIEKAERIGQIGGIFELAVMLHDALLENQSVHTFTLVCQPKVDATINLDKLTRKLKYPVDYFVTFSSIACGRGNTGQSPYGYANSVMERICENRRRDGLHGLAIQWGPIGDVGLLADVFDQEKMKRGGLLLQRLPSWLYAFDKFLQCQHPVVSSVIRMDKQMKTGSSEDNVIKQLWAALGIDPKTVPNDVTLSELGMESFVAVELQQRLERDYDISLSFNEIKRITVGDLKEFQIGNRKKVEIFAVDIKIAKATLSKIQFEIPNEPITKLNSINEGTRAYFLPPIEGIFSNLLPLIKLLPFPVYGLNWTNEMDNLKNIKEIALYYIKLLKSVEPKGNYNLITFSFGSAIGLKMCYKKAQINKLFIIDAFSSEKFRNDLENFANDENKPFDQIIRFINRNFPKSFHERIKNDVTKAKNTEERLNKLIEIIRDFGDKSINGNDLDKIIKGAAKKEKMLIEMRKKMTKKLNDTKKGIKSKIAQEKLFKRKIDCHVNIIKSTEKPDDLSSIENDILESFGLSIEKFESKFHLEVVVGAPEDVLTVNVEKTAEIIKNQMMKA